MGQLFNGAGSNLATVARETGYPVVEVPGWTSHYHAALANHVGIIVWHHTAGPEPEQTKSNYPSLNVVRNGRTGLPGPLSQYGIGFDGTIYVISAGLCYHAGRGSWNGISGNASSIGIEAEDSGDGDWTDAQWDCYPRLAAALSRFLGIGAGSNCGHKEWTPTKIDPAGIDMGWARGKVQHYLDNPHQINKNAGGSAAVPEEAEMGSVPMYLPHSREWTKLVFPTERGGNSAMIDRMWFTIISMWGDTEFVLVMPNYEGGFTWPGGGPNIGSWEEPATAKSDTRLAWELPDNCAAVGIHYRNKGEETASGIAFPQM